MANFKKKIIKTFKAQIPHSISDFILISGGAVPERHPPSMVFDKVGTKRRSFATRSMNIMNPTGISYVDVDMPQYQAMHGSQYVKKHKKRLEREWGR